MQKGFTVLTQIVQQFYDIVEITLADNGIADLVRLSQHGVLAPSILNDFPLFVTIYEPCVHMECDRFFITEPGQDRLIGRLRGILFDCPYTAKAVPADVVVNIEFDGLGHDHVEEVFYIRFAVEDFFG